MTDLSISVALTKSAREAEDHSFITVVLLSCAGLIVSFCLMTGGIDLGAGWMI